MFATTASGENPGPGDKRKTRHKCLRDQIKSVSRHRGVHVKLLLVFGVQTVLWPNAAHEVGNITGDLRSSRTVHGQVARAGG